MVKRVVTSVALSAALLLSLAGASLAQNPNACFGQAASGFASTSKSNATGMAVSTQAKAGQRSQFVLTYPTLFCP
jgi:hypothetical protein